MQKLKTSILTAAMVLVFSVFTLALPVYADDLNPSSGGAGGSGSSSGAKSLDPFAGSCNSATQGTASGNAICDAQKDPDSLTKIITNVINGILFMLGIAAVIMIILGGVRYVTSNGEPNNIKAAKDTILYSVIGLVVAIMAFAIVNFVVAFVGQ